MVLVRLERFAPLVEAISRLAQIAKDADIIFMPRYLQFVALHCSPHFLATLQMPENFFVDYVIENNARHLSRLSLESFHDALLNCTFCSSMTIHLLSNTNQMLLRFEAPEGECRLRHEYLPLFQPRDGFIEVIDIKNYFSIKSQDLRRVIKELPIFRDESVYVTIMPLKVKFSVGWAQMSFTKKDGQCQIEGFGEAETQIKINLNPMLFFINLTYEVNRIYFYKTIKNSCGVMFFPVSDHAKYLIYFPQF